MVRTRAHSLLELQTRRGHRCRGRERERVLPHAGPLNRMHALVTSGTRTESESNSLVVIRVLVRFTEHTGSSICNKKNFNKKTQNDCHVKFVTTLMQKLLKVSCCLRLCIRNVQFRNLKVTISIICSLLCFYFGFLSKVQLVGEREAGKITRFLTNWSKVIPGDIPESRNLL